VRDVDIVHGNDNYLGNADYWSRLGTDLCFNPLFKKYLELTRSLCLLHPVPTILPMLPENMPYYHGPCIIPTQSSTDPSNDAHCQAIISTLLVNNCHGLCHLSNIPVQCGEFEKAIPSSACLTNKDNVLCYAQQVLQFGWAVFSLHGGHFASTIQSRNLPFHVRLACNPYQSG
jgi:hypothetical protein